jgi:hypothetical protein
LLVADLHISPLPDWVRGSVLRWWLAFPQVGFSPTGEYEFISALLCFLHALVGVAGIQLRALAKILFLLFKLEYYINICVNAYVFR